MKISVRLHIVRVFGSREWMAHISTDGECSFESLLLGRVAYISPAEALQRIGRYLNV